MFRKLLKFIIVSCSIIVVPAGSFAEETLTIGQAISSALENNSVLKAYTWSQLSQKEAVLITGGRLAPRISLEEKFTRTDNPTYGFMAKLDQERFTQQDFAIRSLNDPRDISDFRTSFTVEQPVFVPGLLYQVDISKRESRALDAGLSMIRSGVVRDTVRTALMVQTSKEFLRAARSSLNDAMEHKRLAALRYETGIGLYSDSLRADTWIRNAEAAVSTAEGNIEVAKRALGLALGRKEPVDIASERPSLHVDELEIYLDASDRRGDIEAFALRHENAIRGIAMERAAFLPEIGVGASYMLNDHNDPFTPEGDSYLFTAFLRWNLFDVSSVHRVKKAEADQREMHERFEGFRQEVRFRVHEAYIRIREKEKTLALAHAGQKASEEAVRLVRVRYENSLAPMVDLLEAQGVLDSTRAGVVKAENDHANAVLELYYQSGMLLKAFGLSDGRSVDGPLIIQ